MLADGQWLLDINVGDRSIVHIIVAVQVGFVALNQSSEIKTYT